MSCVFCSFFRVVGVVCCPLVLGKDHVHGATKTRSRLPIYDKRFVTRRNKSHRDNKPAESNVCLHRFEFQFEISKFQLARLLATLLFLLLSCWKIGTVVLWFPAPLCEIVGQSILVRQRETQERLKSEKCVICFSVALFVNPVLLGELFAIPWLMHTPVPLYCLLDDLRLTLCSLRAGVKFATVDFCWVCVFDLANSTGVTSVVMICWMNTVENVASCDWSVQEWFVLYSRDRWTKRVTVCDGASVSRLHRTLRTRLARLKRVAAMMAMTRSEL